MAYAYSQLTLPSSRAIHFGTSHYTSLGTSHYNGLVDLFKIKFVTRRVCLNW
ncbi:hypothetical protein HanIR_Chr16g0845111 [Helianthus annuus]|nr:hypothetical protein HanIR_Chr16g0845111 [Helianthus annuus]